ncbi:hypothetical protein [Streptomyces sp. NPDC102409]|uniref:hypothetical protein n=1 Tax=Streptomyces sp. NPDC102409 TaxID=3366172 RepID=UPI0037F14A85
MAHPPRCGRAVDEERCGWIFHDISARARSWHSRSWASLLAEQRNISFGSVQSEPFVPQRVAPHAVVL